MKKNSDWAIKVFLGLVALIGLAVTAFGVAAMFGVGDSQAKRWVVAGPMVIGAAVFYWIAFFRLNADTKENAKVMASLHKEFDEKFEDLAKRMDEKIKHLVELVKAEEEAEKKAKEEAERK